MFTADEAQALHMPEGDKQAVATWYRHEIADLDESEQVAVSGERGRYVSRLKPSCTSPIGPARRMPLGHPAG